MDDVGNAALRFCKYLGLCSYADFRGMSTGVILVNAQ